MNTNGKSGHPCLISYIRGKVFNFSLLSMLAVLLVYEHSHAEEIFSANGLLSVFKRQKGF